MLIDAYIYFLVKEFEENKLLETLSTDALITAEDTSVLNAKLMLTPVVCIFIQEHIALKTNNVNNRYLEQAFANKALHNPDIAELMIISKNITLKMIAKFFKTLDSTNCMANAIIVDAGIQYLEYMIVLDKDITIDHPIINSTIRRLVDSLFFVSK